MFNKFERYLYSTYSSTTDALFECGKKKLLNLIKNHFCCELVYLRDRGEMKFCRALETLRRLSPKKFTEASLYGYASLSLKPGVWFTIPLPKLNSYIVVSTLTVDDTENRDCNKINIYILGKGAVRTARMFENTVNKKIDREIDSEKTKIIVQEMVESTRGVTWARSYCYAKQMQNIFTADKNTLISYLDKWVSASTLFKNLEISYKTGILLYGPPGTGKTSMAKALAAYLYCNLYVVNMSLFCAKNIGIIKELPDDLKIVLLEDIDYIFGKRQNDRTPEEKANGNELLQLLDGVTPVANTIFIATTNDYDSLDAAIIRDGRFDLKIHMNNLTESDAKAMCSALYLKDTDIAEVLQDESYPINPAYLQNKIVQHIFKHLDSFEEVTSDTNIQHTEKKDSPWSSVFLP